MINPLNSHPENDVYHLQEADKDRSSLRVIAATHIDGGGNGTLPTRVVLRAMSDEYVTHLQVFNRDGSHQGFCYGNYFPYERYTGHTTQAEAINAATTDLCERARKYGYDGVTHSVVMQVVDHQCAEPEAATH
jgi:hypothetical protein